MTTIAALYFEPELYFHRFCAVALPCPLCKHWPDLRAAAEFRQRSRNWFLTWEYR